MFIPYLLNHSKNKMASDASSRTNSPSDDKPNPNPWKFWFKPGAVEEEEEAVDPNAALFAEMNEYLDQEAEEKALAAAKEKELADLHEFSDDEWIQAYFDETFGPSVTPENPVEVIQAAAEEKDKEDVQADRKGKRKMDDRDEAGVSGKDDPSNNA